MDSIVIRGTPRLDEQELALRALIPTGKDPITICHPAYIDDNPTLLTLNGYDSESGAIAIKLVKDVLSIITNNRTDGWLSMSSKPSSERISDEEVLLQPGKYFWHLPSSEGGAVDSEQDEPFCYPVLTSFRDWRPPTTLPSHWQQLVPSTDINTARQCVLTRQRYSLQKAHLVPESEFDWLLQNNASLQARTSFTAMLKPGTSQQENLITLSSDVHLLFDARRFTCIPKLDKDSYSLVAHVLDSGDEDISKIFHNIEISSSAGGEHIPFWYARLAWTYIPFLRPFLSSARRSRHVFVTDAKQCDLVSRTLDASKCRQMALERQRSTSPKKRRQSPADRSQGDLCDDDDDDNDVDDDYCNRHEEETDSGVELEPIHVERGRKRRRCDDYTESYSAGYSGGR